MDRIFINDTKLACGDTVCDVPLAQEGTRAIRTGGGSGEEKFSSASAVHVVLLLGFLNRGSQCQGGLEKRPTRHFLHCPRVIFTGPLGRGGFPFPSVLCGLPPSTWVMVLVALPHWRTAPWGHEPVF